MADPPAPGGEPTRLAGTVRPADRTGGEATMIAVDPAAKAGVTSRLDTLIAGHSAGKERSSLGVGDRLGRYRIEGELGAGGMGTVYLAYDPDLDRRVAIKVLHSRASLGDDTLGSQRLLREAQAMARLAHPNVVTVHDVGVLGESLFVAMELIDGTDLRGWLAERPRSWQEIVRAFIEAGKGLVAAHAAAIVHRDFKPENVMVAATGRICVGDFGLAAAANDGEPRATSKPAAEVTTSWLTSAGTMTVPGSVMGTPAYMAPEQMVGGEITPGADIFAFCVALYESLYAQRPFRGATVAALYVSISQGEIVAGPSNKGVPRKLDRLLRRGLAAEVDQRPATMHEIVTSLERMVEPRTLRRLSLAAIGIGAVATAAALWAPEEELVDCGGGRAEMAEIWSEARQATLRSAFEATGSVHAGDTWERAQKRIDLAAEAWIDARQGACVDTHHRAEFSEEVLALRVGCLDRQLGELDRLLMFLGEADGKIIDHAVALVGAAEDPSRCDPAQVLAEAAKGSRRSPEVDTLDVELGRGRRLHRAGKYTEALAVFDGVLLESATLDAPDLRARAVVERSHSAYIDGQRDAPQWLERAVDAAIRVGDDLGFASVAADQLSLVRGAAEETKMWMTIGLAALDRGGGDDRIMAKLYTNFGNARRAQGEAKEALEAHQQALRLYRRVDETSFHVGDAIFNIAADEATLGHNEEGEKKTREALEIWRRELGPLHPRMNEGLRTLALISKMNGDNEEALKAADELLARLRRSHGEAHRHVAGALLVKGYIYVWLGDLDSAEEVTRAALAVIEADDTRVHKDKVAGYMILADVEVTRGNWSEALKWLDLGLHATAKERRPDDDFWFGYYALKADYAFRRGEFAAFKDFTERACATLAFHSDVYPGSFATCVLKQSELALREGRIGEGLGDLEALQSRYSVALKQALMQGRFHWLRARLLDAQGDHRRQAHDEAALAAEAYGRLGPAYEPERVAIQAWLKKHPGEAPGSAPRSPLR